MYKMIRNTMCATVATVLSVLGFSSAAMAALSAEETAIFTDATAKLTDIMAAIWPYVGGFLLAGIGVTLIIKFVKKGPRAA